MLSYEFLIQKMVAADVVELLGFPLVGIWVSEFDYR